MHMRTLRTCLPSLGLSIALFACGGSSSGLSGAYRSGDDVPLSIEFKSGGKVVVSMGEMGSSSGTYTLDGEKILVEINGARHTFVRDGHCISDQLNVFGTLCKGGKAGMQSNVSTRNVPKDPRGSYVAKNEDGEFELEFQADQKLKFSLREPGGRTQTKPGRFHVEGDQVQVTLEDGTPLALRYVNDAYESMAFGLPMRFVKR